MEIMELGSGIDLVNFGNLERDKIVVVKKVVGNFVKNLQERDIGFEKLTLNLKMVHNSEVEILGKLNINGKLYNSEVVSYNLFYALNEILKKLGNEVS